MFRRVEEPGRVAEVRGVDDQSVALPMAYRISHPLANLLRGVVLIQPDDAGIVDHLDEDHHMVSRLHDPFEVVV